MALRRRSAGRPQAALLATAAPRATCSCWGGCDAILDENCPGCTDDGLELGSDGDFARYGAAHGIAILKPCQGGPIDAARFPHNHENLRGMVDVYGQLSADYATQTGHQMAPIGAMIRRLVGEKQVEA